MRIIRFLGLSSAMLMAAPLSVLAQQQAAADTVVFVAGGVGAKAFEILEAQPLEPVSIVKDAPFSAEAVTEFTQQLADGNRIERSFTSSIARDSQGRTRREENIAMVGPFAATGDAPRLVTIDDPVAGLHYTINDQTKVAHRTRAPFMKTRVGRGSAVVEIQGAAVGVRTGPDGLSTAHAGAAGVAGVRLDPLLMGGAPFEMAVRAPDAKTERLGNRNIEGLNAEGTRTTMTIPAGTVGNQLPIEVVSERWFSNELKVPVLVTRRDPRSGETAYRLTNIIRAEPPADLFTAPSNYQLQEGKDILFTPAVGGRVEKVR